MHTFTDNLHKVAVYNIINKNYTLTLLFKVILVTHALTWLKFMPNFNNMRKVVIRYDIAFIVPAI